MKLYFINHSCLFAVEQMMMTLFPGERPVYPEEPPEPEDLAATVSVLYGMKEVTADTLLQKDGVMYRGRRQAPAAEFSDQLTSKRALQRIVRLSFYDAGVQALGQEPPWGALTGVRPVKLPTRVLWEGGTPEEAAAQLRELYHVSPRRVELAMACAQAALAVKRALKPDEVSLYVGIPFCPTRCAYCSFISADVKRSLELVEPYLDGLCAEIDAAGAALARTGRFVRTIYIGGGTPTTLSAGQLARLMERISTALDLSRCTEYTVEAGRPDTITAEKLAVLRDHGATRVSVNPQTMEDHVLAAMGRAHTSAQILEAYELVRQSGLEQVNMDLIAGLPKDTPEGFRRTLDTVAALAPANITVHTLALKKSAALFQHQENLPSPEAVAGMLDYAWDRLEALGYVPYYLYRQKYMSGSFENVGWCKPGTENVYNICMMEELHPVLSLGAGGVTKLTDGSGQLTRLCNPKYAADYLENLPRVLADKEKAADYFSEAAEPSA